MSLITYLNKKGIVTMATVLSAFTFVYITAITHAVLDPIFDYLFPEKKLKELNIVLPNGVPVKMGILFLETIRWVVYVVSFYKIFSGYME